MKQHCDARCEGGHTVACPYRVDENNGQGTPCPYKVEEMEDTP